MKTIIKKIASFLVVILLICMINCIAVLAEQLPTYYISEKTESDNTLSVTISFTENVAAAGTIKLTYNQDKLTLMSALKGSSKAQMITINDKEKGLVTVNFLNAEDVIKDDTNIAVLTFSIDSSEVSVNDILVESFKLYDLDSKLLSDNTTVEAVYNVDTEDIPADISFVSENVEESSVRMTSNEQNSKQSSVENSQSDNGNTTESSSQASDSSESKSAEITDESDYKETSDETTESEGIEDSSTIESIDGSDTVSLNSSYESAASNNQKNDNTGTETPVLVIVIICIVVLVTAAAAAFIIRKQKSKKETGGHENER